MENLFVKTNPLQDLVSIMNAVISTNERAWSLTGHVTFKLPYNQIYQMKTTESWYYQLFPGATAGIIRMQVLFKGGPYMRKYGT
mgnify:FL=1